MDETVYVIFKVQFDFALQVWFRIYPFQCYSVNEVKHFLNDPHSDRHSRNTWNKCYQASKIEKKTVKFSTLKIPSLPNQ